MVKHNYHLLRIGCFPFTKYHLTKRPWSDLRWENLLYKAITVANLGLPSAVYGVAAVFLITHTEYVATGSAKIPIHFLIPEDH